MDEEIQRADEKFRVRVLIAMTVVALLGAIAILRLNAHLLELQTLAAEALPEAAEKMRTVVRLVLGASMAVAVSFSTYLGWISWRALRTGRFPPPGILLLSDTRVRQGHPARRYGVTGLVMAVLIVLLAAAITHRASRLFDLLLDTSLKPTLYQPAPD